jgi:hypothetical protein
VEGLAEEGNNHYRHEEQQQLFAICFRQKHPVCNVVKRCKSSDFFVFLLVCS